ncbi:MAG TPA: hypothetical protein VK629_05975 [Steroidobacteraceae bacterium]|nr:hypothetical protein [Steroidobacteraceae bacterium]
MKAFSYYDKSTGRFTGRTVSTNLEGDRLVAFLSDRKPDGCAILEGRYDRNAHRVDIATGEVVAYQRPADEIAAEQRRKAARVARAELESIDRRAVRYLMDELAGNLDSEGRRRLDAMNARKIELRRGIQQ